MGGGKAGAKNSLFFTHASVHLSIHDTIYLPCIPGTMISSDKKKMNEIWFLQELDVLETYKANPKWNTAVPGHSCHGQCHHHYHRVLYGSGPVTMAFAQINTVILPTAKCGRSSYLLHLKAQDTGHREVHWLAKVTQLAMQLDFDSLLFNTVLFQMSSRSTEAKSSAFLT